MVPSLDSICDFYSPAIANILFMLLHFRLCQFFHSPQLTPPMSRTRVRNQTAAIFMLNMKKMSQFKCEKRFWWSDDSRRTRACRWNLHHVWHKWNVVAGGSSSGLFNQFLCRQWGWGPLAPVSQAKWLWCEMTGAFTEAALPFPSLSFSLSHTHTHPTLQLPSLGNQ